MNLITPKDLEKLRMEAGADQRQVGGSHYKNMPIQPWDVMQAVMSKEEFVGFLKGNIIKYSMRAGQKAGASDDGEKAMHYRQKLNEITKGEAR